MANRHMKRCPILLISGKCKSKPPWHLTLVRMTVITRTTSKCWPGYIVEGNLVHCWWEWKLVYHYEEQWWSICKKLNIELPYNPEVPFLFIYLEKTKTLTRKDTRILKFISIPKFVCIHSILIPKLIRNLSAEELMFLNCGVGEDSWECLGLQGDPTSPC